jgi:hypothetical protein
MYNVDPDRPIDQILADIKGGALQSFQSPMGTSNPGALFAPFAALIVHLSRDVDAAAKRMERLTKWLVGLTVAILTLTALLLAKEAADIYERQQRGQHHIEPKIDGPAPLADAPG